MPRLHRQLLSFLVQSVVAGTAAAGVTVVDPGGGNGAAVLQAAIDAAQSGDILLLHAGDYSGTPIVVSGKGVALITEAGRITLSGLLVKDIPADKVFVLRGVDVAVGGGDAIALTGPGRTWIEDCSSHGGTVMLTLGSGNGLDVVNIPGAIVTRCTIEGGAGLDQPPGPAATQPLAQNGGHGVHSLSSSLVLQDCVVTGGRCGAGLGDPPFSVFGGDGINVFGNLFSILGGTLTGGNEPAGNPPYSHPGSGATAVFTFQFDDRAATFAGGIDEGTGLPAAPKSFAFTLENVYPATLRSWEAASPVRELQPAAWSVHGEVGDQVFVMVSTAVGAASLPGKQGTLVLGTEQPLLIAPLGTITDPGGVLEGAMPMPRLPPGLDGMVLYTQLSVVSAQGEALLGTGSALVWLSATL